MFDFGDIFVNSGFESDVLYRANSYEEPIPIKAIVYNNYDQGNEGSRSTPNAIAKQQAEFITIIISTTDVPERPAVHSEIIEGDNTYDILVIEPSRIGTWRIQAKVKGTTASTRRRV